MLQDPWFNKGTAFPLSERERLGAGPAPSPPPSPTPPLTLAPSTPPPPYLPPPTLPPSRRPHFSPPLASPPPPVNHNPLSPREGLRGLLPPRILSQSIQESRLLHDYYHGVEMIGPEDVALGGVTAEMARRWQLLQGLQDRNETLFYKVRGALRCWRLAAAAAALACGCMAPRRLLGAAAAARDAAASALACRSTSETL